MVAPSRFRDLLGPLVFAPAPALGHTAETHRWARGVLLRAWDRWLPGDEPTLEEIQAIQSLAAHDGQYGRGWPDKPSPLTGYQTSMSQCNNWGAIQCKCKAENGVCCEGCGYWFDSTPTPEGQRYFEQCFRCYATPEDGALDVLKFLGAGYPKVMDALPSGNLDEIAWQMRLGNYFHGFTTDKREAARQYAEAMEKQAKAIAEALDEPLVAYRKGEGPLGLSWGAIGLGVGAGLLGLAFVAPGAIMVPLLAVGDAARWAGNKARNVIP